ncbi:phosphatase PAP2 family protein [Neolewinella aurantiaca]|uniref:Phosphatase PAP2 family protein n=1 Tax=Neolewinella aurantiaca TaxID=2602767 RepID=A0A5C7FKL5_9BACT|nr:phosphatase PAP2 family protein [Neolewinella aurantiaca]TXF87865.1 phosphatase PAP2 family protein [Neolewinella aurantiaca]
MNLRLLFFTALLAASTVMSAQVQDTLPAQDYDIHAVNPWVSIPLIIAGTYLSATRLKTLQDVPALSPTEIATLNPDDVPGFDRWAIEQPVREDDWAGVVSDQLFAAGELVPLTLLIWKKYRKDFLPIGLMFLEAQATQGLFYGYAPFGPTGVERFRPRVYVDEYAADDKFNGQTRNSMFSGHVSTTSTGFYFVAKIIDDYNPDLTGGQKVMLYGAASIPGLFSGYLRVRAFKHFPTDSLIGLGVGAFSGIMIPNFHRWWAERHRSRAMLQPIMGNGAAGMSFNLKF